jgi:hypothetical protein
MSKLLYNITFSVYTSLYNLFNVHAYTPLNIEQAHISLDKMRKEGLSIHEIVV